MSAGRADLIADMIRPDGRRASEPAVRYETPVYDSGRWRSFRPRSGDIIICTPNKCGTTWTQMLCALLVHDGRLPQPLNRLSRWLDRHTEPVEHVIAAYEAQTHRRIVKTHTPFDGLPYHEEVFYIFCGRDPRDAFLSMMDHMANMSDETLAEVARRAGMPDGIIFPQDPNELFPLWLTVGELPGMPDGFPFGSVLYHSKTYWAARHLPNLLFLHYADLSTRLDAEVARLGRFLGLDVDARLQATIAAAASFEAMKRQADDVAPAAHLNEWRRNSDFFRQARIAQWRDVLTPDNLSLYDAVATERLGSELKLWLEQGRAASAWTSE